MTVLDVSLGGVLVSGPAPLPAHRPLQVTFASTDGTWSTMLTSRVAYSRTPARTAGGISVYLTGLTFLAADSPPVQQKVLELLDRATAVLTVQL